MDERSDGSTPAGVRVPLVPCLWFDDRAEEAAAGYVDVFPDARIVATSRYPEGFDNPAGKPRGSVLTVEFELGGQGFTALNGGPQFTINPSISFFVHADSAAETDRIAGALVDGGAYLMEPGSYPWSPRYAWVQDRYGVSWQVMASDDGRPRPLIVPCLMFAGEVEGRAQEALRHYADAFPGGSIEALVRYEAGEGPEGAVKHGRAALAGNPLVTMDSHVDHEISFNEAVSLQVLCRDQEEVDHYWSTLGAGGEEGPCGWLKDRFGVSWQVVPLGFVERMKAGEGSDPGYERAFRAMLGMKKLDVAELEAAWERAPDPSGDAT